MDNLVKQAAGWLRNEASRSKTILERTDAVLTSFKAYLLENKKEIEEKTGLSSYAALNKVVVTQKTIRQILSAFLRGNQLDALQKTHKMMQSMKFDRLSPDIPLYKCRENSKLFHLTQKEMFHIPYDKRCLVGNQRFSLSGLPCLYLGGSSYICWEELGRKDFSTSNYCGYSLRDYVNLFDLLLPVEITSPHQIRRIVLTLACSLAASRDDLFKPEYILPQCILHSLIYRSFYSHQLFCVRYYSSHFLNGDADYFEEDFENPFYLPRYVNYVFPAASSMCEGYNEELKAMFNQTETVSLMHETLLDTAQLMGAIGTDVYLKSQFGKMDAILDKKLGFTPKREEGELVYFRPSDVETVESPEVKEE